MIAEEVQKKIWLGALIGAVIIGLLFLVWAVFLNRGTIIMHAKAPYTLIVEGLKTENCMSDECTVIVAPGDYSLTLQKVGYKSLTKSISVPLGSPYQDNITLQYIPAINDSTKTKDEVFPPKVQLTQAQRDTLGISAATRVFFDDSNTTICYIVRNPDNYRQTLYRAGIGQNGEPGKPEIVTSFLRDLQSFVVSPSPAGDKVAVIDQGAEQATLYMVDLQAKNRASLLSYPMIRDMRWIPGTSDFLLQARETNDTFESIFLYRWEDGKTTKLELRTPLEDIAIVDKNRLLAVTNQMITVGGSTFSALEGQLIPLGENQSTAEVSALVDMQLTDAVNTSSPPVYSFVDYSLISNQARLITTLGKGSFPAAVKAGDDGKSLYFLQRDKALQLRFDE